METTAIQNLSNFNDSQITILTQETPANLVRQRKGRGGKIFDYLPHEQATRILNQAFNFGWSFKVLHFQIVEDVESWVLGELSVRTSTGEPIIKQQFGQQDFLRNPEGKVVMSVGDCLKGAASDALTKCASLLGVGLDLYGVTGKEKREQSRRYNQKYPPRAGNNGSGKQYPKCEQDALVYELIQETKGMKFNGEGAYAHFTKKFYACKSDKSKLKALAEEISLFLDADQEEATHDESFEKAYCGSN